MFKYFTIVLIVFFSTAEAFGSDAYVLAEDGFGQGFFRSRGLECFFITAGHVVEDSTEIELITSQRHRYNATVITIYPDDVAILRVELPANASCPKSSWDSGRKLKILLNMEQEGIVKTRLDDGSQLQTAVVIKTFNAYRYIQIVPKDSNDQFAKGFSGSPLFIAGKLAGMLQSVSNGVGKVFRQDALNNTVSLFFNAEQENKEIPPGNNKNIIAVTDDVIATASEKPVVFKGSLSEGQTVEHEFEGIANSPVLFTTAGTDNLRYYVQVFKGKKNLYERLTHANSESSHPFTPQKNGTYTAKLLGFRSYGEYSLTIEKK